jgi:ABC-type antimicrobial peptide transport system permease subunit
LFPSLRTINDYVAEPLARPRVTAALFVGFAVVALLLSALGLYGVISATMVERTREIGIRMALGSSRKAILRSVLAEGARLTLSGLAVGTILALSSSGWLEATLYGVNHREPMPLLVVALFVCVVTGLAAYVPARRAANVEPSLALREW